MIETTVANSCPECGSEKRSWERKKYHYDPNEMPSSEGFEMIHVATETKAVCFDCGYVWTAIEKVGSEQSH